MLSVIPNPAHSALWMQQQEASSTLSYIIQMFGLIPTLRQADGLSDLEPVDGAEVPTGVQRDDPRPVLDVAVLGSHSGALQVDVHGTMTHCGLAWGRKRILINQYYLLRYMYISKSFHWFSQSLNIEYHTKILNKPEHIQTFILPPYTCTYLHHKMKIIIIITIQNSNLEINKYYLNRYLIWQAKVFIIQIHILRSNDDHYNHVIIWNLAVTDYI